MPTPGVISNAKCVLEINHSFRCAVGDHESQIILLMMLMFLKQSCNLVYLYLLSFVLSKIFL